ncbi:MAG: ABC transporter ATP-binding protein, partial [Clostridia bacterium]|nr:ABC transporter ATP-binding protein [Clostridia bacterium]
MKEKSKNNLNTIRKATGDLFTAMPDIVTVKIVLGIVSALVSVVNVSLLANITDCAGRLINGEPVMNVFAVNVAGFISCGVFLQFGSVLAYYMDNILIVPKMEFFHHRLSDHLVDISLEATHDPQIQNMFWRAKDAIYQDRIMAVFMTVFNILPTAIQLIGTLAVLFNYSPVLVALAFISVFPSALLSFWIGRREYGFSVEHTQTSRLSHYLWEIVTKKETVRENRIYGFMDYLKKRFLDVNQEFRLARKKLLLKEDAGRGVAELLKNILYIVALVFAVGLVGKNVITVGMFAACIGVFASMQGKATDLFDCLARIDAGCKYANDYYDFLNLPKEISGAAVAEKTIQNIELANVSYGYQNGQKYAVDDASLTVKRGQFTVIVGENGSGKTTLSKLILGLYKPQKGELSIDGRPVTGYSCASYLKHYSVAIQNFERYAVSLGDNVRIGSISSDGRNMDDLFAVLDLAEVRERLGGYDSMLGIEFGDADLSGGEWQRIALARAMFKNADVVVLDEPTSAIDPMLEYDLLNQFLNVAKEKTCIVISHRIGLCKKADNIIVMEKGRIVGQGRHEYLVENN